MFTRRIDRITRVQYALITRAQALVAGLTDADIRVLLRRGMWFELRPSVYAIAGAPQSWHQILLASVLAFGCDSWASHATASHLWAMKGFDEPQQLEVVSTLRSRTRASTGCTAANREPCSTVTSRLATASRQSPPNAR